jgi:hypothetical protein
MKRFDFRATCFPWISKLLDSRGRNSIQLVSKPPQRHHARVNSASNAFTSCKSFVSNPEVVHRLLRVATTTVVIG